MPAERFRDVGFRAMRLASRTTIILSFGARDDDSAEWPISSGREDTHRMEEGLRVASSYAVTDSWKSAGLLHASGTSLCSPVAYPASVNNLPSADG
ncbi:hypothetical protein Bamb_5335 [Burkholderia ambifaria AMMD]|uniref:Uncharacterized protein n=1 Tax=Burkholderia ambifaria (strain ATCC BAA-244 / DSM 16087 / CCUG 44356 / LMG 19182 / AMMD) TaxID=339670 RepID=Q0B4P1_BURCM|nr:hypothetical protein Bamb_5335 [Burkholderia ambifaria AMMD]